MPSWLGSGEGSLPGLQMATSCDVLTWQGEGEGERGAERETVGVGWACMLSVSLLIKALIPSWGPHPHDLV